MKKIALLFTILCVGQLYGMEEQSPYHALPKELQKEIVNTALATSKSVDNAVDAIRIFGTLHKVHYGTQSATNLLMTMLPNDLNQAINQIKNLQGTTPQDFTKLVHILADKFKTNTLSVASQFINLKINRTAAEKYIDSGLSFSQAIMTRNLTALNTLINEGADVNFTNSNGEGPLKWATEKKSQEIIKILRAAGAQ
jgi:hypothetical protein